VIHLLYITLKHFQSSGTKKLYEPINLNKAKDGPSLLPLILVISSNIYLASGQYPSKYSFNPISYLKMNRWL
jgi:hypothetical protein